MKSHHVRNSLLLGTAFTMTATAALADPLVDLLKAKGVISASDASSIEAVPAGAPVHASTVMGFVDLRLLTP